MLPADTIYIYEHYVMFQGGKESTNHLECNTVKHEVIEQDKDIVRTRELTIFVKNIGEIHIYHSGDELEEVSSVLWSYSPELKKSAIHNMKQALFNKLDREMAKRNKVIQRLKEENPEFLERYG